MYMLTKRSAISWKQTHPYMMYNITDRNTVTVNIKAAAAPILFGRN